MNPLNRDEAQFAAQIKTTLNQARPQAQVRQQLAAVRQAALRANSMRGQGAVLAWLNDHRFGSLMASAALLLAIIMVWPAQSNRAPQLVSNDVTQQVVDDILYDSLDDF